MSRNCSKNHVECARCHLAGLASGIDCTVSASSQSGAARRSVSARTARKASRQRSREAMRGSFGEGAVNVGVESSWRRRRRTGDEVGGVMPNPRLEKSKGDEKPCQGIYGSSLYVRSTSSGRLADILRDVSASSMIWKKTRLSRLLQ